MMKNFAYPVRFVEFDDRFVRKSGEWLKDEELRYLINLSEFDPEKQKIWVEYFRSNPDKCLVRGLEVDETPSGACGIKHILSDENGNKIGEYWGYIGDKSLRGKGIGGQMVDEMIQSARELGISKLYLKVMEYNLPARKLYIKKGFEVVSGGQEIIMEKKFSENQQHSR